MLPTQLFLSYRREDAGHHASSLYRELTERFDETHAVFQDVHAIRLSDNFHRLIGFHVAYSRLLVVLIDSQWLPLLQQRQGTPDADYVQFEIKTALEHDKPILPVLFGGTELPSESQLPEAIRDLVKRQAVFEPAAPLDYASLADKIMTCWVNLEPVNVAAMKGRFPLDLYRVEMIQKITDVLENAADAEASRRRSRLATALFHCCQYIGCHNLKELIEVLGEQPREAAETVRQFVGQRSLFHDLLKNLRGCMWELKEIQDTAVQFLEGFDAKLDSLLANPGGIEYFEESWRKLEDMVCGRAAAFERQRALPQLCSALTSVLQATMLMTLETTPPPVRPQLVWLGATAFCNSVTDMNEVFHAN